MLPYQDVHKGVDPDPEGDNYQPSEEEKKDIALVEKILARNKKAKSKYDERWPDYYGMFRGKQWKEARPSYRHSEVINLIFREIQASVPIQLDSRPKFEYLPMEPSDIQLAEIINKVAEADWERYSWNEQLTESVYDANILGTGIGGMGFDQTKEDGLGAICFDSEDPFYHFPSPDARDVNKRNKAHIVAEPMSLDEIKSKWPNGKYVSADSIDIKKMDFEDKDRIKVKSPVNASIVADKTQQDDGTQDQALVITCYIDGSMEIDEEEVSETDDSGALNTKYVQKKKYPRGRKIVVANKVWLEGGENEFEDGRFPYARFQNYVNQRQFWGISDIEQLESPQKTFNKLISFALDVLTLMGNPVWKVGTGSGVDTENLFNQPGLIIEADDISQVQREEGVQLQPYVLQLIDRLKVWFDDVSGSSDVSRGVKPEGVTAAAAISTLQDATQTRIRQKSRNLDVFLQNIGQLYQSRVFQYYTAPRVFRLTNQDGSMQFFKFHVATEETENGPAKFVKYRPFVQREDGTAAEGDEISMPVKGSLDLRVVTGSMLPFVKSDRENKAFKLFELGIIDEEEVLKALDYPNWESVLQRVMQRRQEQAAAQAQEQSVPA